MFVGDNALLKNKYADNGAGGTGYHIEQVVVAAVDCGEPNADDYHGEEYVDGAELVSEPVVQHNERIS